MSLERIHAGNRFTTNQVEGFVALAKDVNPIVNAVNTLNAQLSYKVYTGLISQSGTDAPTVNIFTNTLGNIVWTRSSDGFYVGTLTGELLATKTFCYIGACYDGDVSSIAQLSALRATGDDNTVTLITLDSAAFTGVDSVLTNTPIEIRVYN